MEPWLDMREITSKEDSLLLSKKAEETLAALSILIGYSFKTRNDKIFKVPTLSALPYYMSIVPAIFGAKNAYRYYCGDKLKTSNTIAVSTYINPDTIMGLKEPLIRYANAMPEILQNNVDFFKGVEYGLFLFCFRTLIFVLEELLLATSDCDIRPGLMSLYEMDSAFEQFKSCIIIMSKEIEAKKTKCLTSKRDIKSAAARCIDALRMASKEFYVIEMMVLKNRANKSGVRVDNNEPMQKCAEPPAAVITKKSMADYMKKIFGEKKGEEVMEGT